MHISLKDYIQAWHKIPSDIDIEQLNIDRIRYVKEWGTKTAPEDGFIVEFKTQENSYKELLGRSELGLSAPEFKKLLGEMNKNGLLFGKSFVTHQDWYQYPVIWGMLDDVFDNASDYQTGGKFEGGNYIAFGRKYD